MSASRATSPLQLRWLRLTPGDTKFTPPRTPANLVARRRLVRQLVDTDAELVTVTAPAGYGKTTLLAEWAQATQLPIAWLTLETTDTEPAALLTSLTGALETLEPVRSRPSGWPRAWTGT